MPKEIEGVVFYTVQDIAEATDVTPQTVRAWIKRGDLKAKRIGRPMLVKEETLREFLVKE